MVRSGIRFRSVRNLGKESLLGHPRRTRAAFPPSPAARSPRGGGVEEEEARTGSTHRARRASPDRPRRPARSGGEGPGGGAARAPIWKCQLCSAAWPQPRRKRKSLRLPQAHPAARPSPRGTPSPRQGLRHRALSLTAQASPRVCLTTFPVSWTGLSIPGTGPRQYSLHKAMYSCHFPDSTECHLCSSNPLSQKLESPLGLLLLLHLLPIISIVNLNKEVN
ncbi:uncharacterized protein LOC123934741 [Meles meles]|uniref:uncharacterized protein LOC123934741 n=1 Tax=Meles meles TaxID=9662 RepID=UPI001E69FE5C|nr:uncharacterized protein LOC123934741 [Meles meles]